MGGTACGSGGSERVKAVRGEDGRAALEHGGAHGRCVGGAGEGEERRRVRWWMRGGSGSGLRWQTSGGVSEGAAVWNGDV